MSLTNSEIVILAAPVATTCAALCLGAAVYFSVMRRRKSLPKYRAVAVKVASREEAVGAVDFVAPSMSEPRPRKASKTEA